VGNPAEENDRMPDDLTLAKPALLSQALFYPDFHGTIPGEKPVAT